MGTEHVRTICFECHSRCGVILEIKDGKVLDIKGDKDHPHSHGYTCPKGRACMEIIYHPDRITQPLVRVGDKHSGKFEKVSWDKALDVVAENLQASVEKSGPESVALPRN